jgi:hypothetical protein
LGHKTNKKRERKKIAVRLSAARAGASTAQGRNVAIEFYNFTRDRILPVIGQCVLVFHHPFYDR